MDVNELRRLLDDVAAGRRTAEALDRVAGGLTRDDLREALDYVGERVGLADEAHDIESWTRLTGDLLYRWALGSDDDISGLLAATSADLFRKDLQDVEAAEAARIVAAVRSLNPVAMTTLFDSIGDELAEEPRIRLIRALSVLGDEPTRVRFQPMLESAMEAGRLRLARDTAHSGRLEQARELINNDGLIAEIVALLDQHIEASPGDLEALSLITGALVKAGRDDEVEFRYRRGLDSLQHSKQVEVLFELGRFHREVRHDLLLARGALEESLALDKANSAALELWVSVMGDLGLADEALASLEKRRLEASGTIDEARVLPVLARAYLASQRPDDAERTWRRVRAIDPRNVAALRFYEEYHRSRGDFQTLFTTLQFQLSVVEDPEERVRVNRLMAAVAEENLKNPERAVEAWKRVLAIRPNDSVAEKALMDLYLRLRKWHALVEFHNERFRRLPPEAVDEKVVTLFKIIENYQDPDRLPSTDNVLATYARIVEVSPTHKEALDTLARGYQDRERWPDLLKVLQKKVLVTEDPVELLEMFQQIAEIAITRMSNETQAIPFLERILELDPENLAVVQRLKTIYQHKHNQEKLYGMHLRELKMLAGPGREQVLIAAATMARDRLLRYDEALRLFEELHRTNSNSREARENMHQLYARLERWQDYASFLAEEVERPMPARRRIELMHKWGEVLADRLGESGKARLVFERVLTIDAADDISARRLEQIYLDLEDLPALQRLFSGRQDLRSYVALLSQREAKEDDPSRKVALNLAMAQACENDLGEPSRAARYLEKAFSLDHGLVDVGRRLLAACEAQGDLERVSAILRDLAPAVVESDERLDLFLRLHDVLERLGDHTGAFHAGTDAVRVAMTLGRVASALEKLRATVVSGGLWQEFAGVLQEVSAATMDADFRQELLLELGQIFKGRLLFHDEAWDVLERVLDLDPGNLTAMDLLEDIALQREDWTGLENVLRRRIDVARNEGEARDIRMRLGRLYEDLLGDDGAAAECYVQVVQATSGDREALAGLHRTYEHTERFVDLADVIRMEIAAAAGIEWERLRLQAELAQLSWEHLDDVDEALRLLQLSLGSESHAPEALRQLRVLFDRRIAREAAANLMAPYFRNAGRTDELLDLLHARLDDIARPEAAASILMEMADIRERAKGDPAGAFDLIEAAVLRHPVESFVERLCLLADATGRHREAAIAIGRWVGIVPEGIAISDSTIPDAAREARFSLVLGHLYAERLDEPRLAIKALEKALPFDAGDESLLRTLLELYRRVGDRDSAMQTFDHLADAAVSTQARRVVLLSRAHYAREQGCDDDAIDTLQHVLDLEVGDDAAADLEVLLEKNEHWSELVRLLERREGWTGEPVARAELIRRQAIIQSARLNRLDRAADLLRRALVDDRDREDLRVEAEALALRHELPGWRDWAPALLAILEEIFRGDPAAMDRLARVYRAKADCAASPWECVVALNELAALERERGNLDAAFAARVKALRTMPDDGSLADSVVEAGEEAGKPESVVEALESVAPTAGIEGRVRMLLCVARTWRTRLDDATRAMAIYDQLLELQPGSMSVMREVDDLLHAQGREAERIPLLTEMAVAAPTLDERRQTHLTIGMLCQTTGDFDGAVRAFRYVLDRRPSEDTLDQSSLDAALRLLGLAETLGRVRDSVDLHLLVGRAGGEPAGHRLHLLAAARLLMDTLNDSSEANRVYDELLALDPLDLEARNESKIIARNSPDGSRLLMLLKDELSHAPDAISRVDPLMELADIHLAAGEMGRVDALGCLSEILETVPAHSTALERLDSLILDPSSGAEPAGLLLTASQRTGDVAGLARALRCLISLCDQPTEAVELRIRLAVSLRTLGRCDESRTVLEEAYRFSPQSDKVFAALTEALESDGVLGGLSGITLSVVGSIEEPSARLSARLRAAAVLLRAGLADEVVALLEANVLELESDIPSLEMLTLAFETLGRPDKVLETLENTARVHHEPAVRREIRRRCAMLAELEMADPVKATGFWWLVLEDEPLDSEALVKLAQLQDCARDCDGCIRLVRHELAKRQGSGLQSDIVRQMELRRRLVLLTLDAGFTADAVTAAVDLLESGTNEGIDLTVARRAYAEAGTPPELFLALSSAYEAVVDRDGLLDLYRYAAGMDLAIPTKVEVLRLAVDIEESLGRDDDLFEDLTVLIEIDAADSVQRARLEAAGRRIGRLDGVRNSLVAAFESLTDRPESFDVAMALARILQDDLGREDDAADWLKLAFLRRPGDAQVIEALSALYSRLSRFADLAHLFENLGDLEQGVDERLAFYFKAYDVMRFRVKDPTGATNILKKVLDQEPGNRGALEGLESLARETGDSGALCLWLGRKAEMATTPSDRRSTLLELATVQEGVRDDASAAIVTLCRLVEVDPQCDEAWRRLEGIYVATQRYENLADLYEQQAALAASREDTIESLKKAAGICESRLGDPGRAILLLRRILDADSGNAYAFFRLSELLDSADDALGLVELLVARLAHTVASSEIVDLNARVGMLWANRLGDDARAVEHLKAALAIDPFHATARAGLERLLDSTLVAMEAALVLEGVYEAAGDYALLCGVLEREIPQMVGSAERESVRMRIAEVRSERVGDISGAVETLADVLLDNPSNKEAASRLVILTERIGTWDRLTTLLAECAGRAESPDDRIRLRLAAAEIAERNQHQPSLAAQIYAAHVAENPTDDLVLGELDRLYQQLRRTEDLVGILKMRVACAGEAVPDDLRLRLSALLSQDGVEVDGAVEQLGRVLEGRPGHPEAIRQLSTLASDPVAGRHALEVLRSAFRSVSDDEGLLWAVERLIDVASDSSDVVSLHDEAADAAMRLGRRSVEVEHLGRALGLVPSDEGVLVRLIKASREGSLQATAFGYLSSAASGASWPELEKSLLLQAVRLGVPVGVPAQAIETSLQRVMAIDPVCKEALLALDKMYEAGARGVELAGVLDQRLRLDLSPDERVEVLSRLAHLSEENGDFARAAGLLEEIAGIRPDMPGLRSLLRLAQAVDDPLGQIRALERLADLEVESDSRVSCLLEAASLWENRLQDKTAAVATLEKVCEIDPRNAAACIRLEKLYDDLGEYGSLVRMLTEISDSDAPDLERRNAAMKAAAITETHLDDLHEAVGLVKRAAELDPDDDSVLDELIRLFYRSEDWTSLVGVLRRKAVRMVQKSDQVALLAKACDVAVHRLGDLVMGGGLARQIMALEPQHPRALLTLARLMVQRDQNEEAASLFQRLAQSATDPDERVDALVGLARLRFAAGDRGDSVRKVLQEAAKLRPQNVEVNRFLKKLYLESGEHHALIEVMLRELKQAKDDAERASICMDVADIYLKQMNDGEKFLQWAEEAHRFGRDDPRVVGGIVRYHLQSGEPHRAVPYLEWLVNYLESTRRLKELPPFAFELARIVESLGQQDKAIQYYRLAHEHDAGNVPNSMALGRLYLARGENDKALRIFQPLILRMDSLASPARIELLISLSKVHVAQGDKRKARQFVLRVLQEEPANAEAQALLSKGL
jgi:tetratricopeptide (TPR) repeat protein